VHLISYFTLSYSPSPCPFSPFLAQNNGLHLGISYFILCTWNSPPSPSPSPSLSPNQGLHQSSCCAPGRDERLYPLTVRYWTQGLWTASVWPSQEWGGQTRPLLLHGRDLPPDFPACWAPQHCDFTESDILVLPLGPWGEAGLPGDLPLTPGGTCGGALSPGPGPAKVHTASPAVE
jgi:hypothetical protein